RKTLVKRIYRTLARYAVESFASYSMPFEEMSKRVIFKEELEKVVEASEVNHVFILCSHLGNWEMILPMMPAMFSAPVYGIYHPVSNKVLDPFLVDKRGRFGLKMISMTQAPKKILSVDRPSVFILLSDQSPPNTRGGVWIRFLGVETF